MSDLTVTKTSKRNVTEIPPPQKAVTTQHVQETCSCNVCGLGGIEPEAAPPDVDADGSEDVSESSQKTGPEAALPKRGNYGIVILKVAENFLQRMPHSERKEPATAPDKDVPRDSPQHSVHDRHESGRSGHKSLISYGLPACCMWTDIASLNGKLVWVWIFFDPETGNTLFVIRPTGAAMSSGR